MDVLEIFFFVFYIFKNIFLLRTKRPLQTIDTFRDPFIKRKAPVVPHGGFNNTVLPVPNYNVYGNLAAPVTSSVGVYRSTGNGYRIFVDIMTGGKIVFNLGC